MVQKTPDQIQAMMGVSSSIAELNFDRFQEWEHPFTIANARPAVLAFSGDVYMGLDVRASFSERDYTHAQKTLRILSGLYGVLRPLDLMQPYRLEMGSRLSTPAGSTLYKFWGDEITDSLNSAIEQSPGADVLVNLASNEYFGAVQTNRVTAPIVSPAFLDAKGAAEPKMVSFFAKKARGAMSAWIIQNRVKSRRALTGFDRLGYSFDADRSTPDRPVFSRRGQ